MSEAIHADPTVSAIFYIGLAILALLALIPIGKMVVAAFVKFEDHTNDDSKPPLTTWDVLKPVLSAVAVAVAVYLVLLGGNKTMENFSYSNAKADAPLPAFTESAKAEKEALKPQTKTDLAEERAEEAEDKVEAESKALDRKAADEAGKLLDFRNNFPALQGGGGKDATTKAKEPIK